MMVDELRVDSTSYELDIAQGFLVFANIFILAYPVLQTSWEVFGSGSLAAIMARAQLEIFNLIARRKDGMV